MTRSDVQANLPERQKAASGVARSTLYARKNVPQGWLCRIGLWRVSDDGIGLGRVLTFDFSGRFANVDFETIIDFEPSKMATPITP